MRFRNTLLFFLVLFSPLIALSGCDDSLNPIVGEERPFTIWGLMNAKADTQMVRVFAIEDRLGLDRDGPIDARVTSIDLTTDERVEWRDSLIQFGEDSYGHVFYAPFRAQTGHAYRLEVVRSDGATSSVEVTVPPDVEVEIDREAGFTFFPVKIKGENPNLINLEVEYDTITMTARNLWPPGTPPVPTVLLPVAIPYADRVDKTSEGLEIRVDMLFDHKLVKDEYVRNCLVEDLIGLRRIELRFLVADQNWQPPGGVFDPEVLSQPGAFSNVENGFGYFGAGHAFFIRWVVPQDVQRASGFTTSAPCGFMPQDIPLCQIPPEPCLKDD